MQKLLEAIEQAGYRDEDGTLLTNSLDWHMLRQRVAEVIAYAVEADKVVKLVETQHTAYNTGPYR